MHYRMPPLVRIIAGRRVAFWTVAFAGLAATDAGSGPYSIATVLDGVPVALASGHTSMPVSVKYALAGGDYAAVGGWIGFTKPGSSAGVKHVWTRAPDGTTRQATAFNGATASGLSAVRRGRLRCVERCPA